MNILVLDCAVSKISIALSYDDDKFICHTYDIGMKQSEILVPAIDDVLSQAGISPSDLNCSALTVGPGSFTGLRLGISALKALELAYGVPVYGISSLKTYYYAYKNLHLPVLTCIDANKGKFYAAVYDENGKEILPDGDYESSFIIEKLNFEKIFVTGPDAKKFCEILENSNKKIEVLSLSLNSDLNSAISLVEITKQMIFDGVPPLQDYDGPVYLRASEAELKLGK